MDIHRDIILLLYFHLEKNVYFYAVHKMYILGARV